MREFRSGDGRFRVQIGDEVWVSISTWCEQDYPRETGGVLVGYYTSDLTTAVVTRALGPPPDSEKGRARFERGTHGLGEVLRHLWRRPAATRRYYLGEWHLHPCGGAKPSATDDRQMQAIARGPYSCPEPVLIIVGGRPEAGWAMGCWVYPRGAKVSLGEGVT